MMEAGLKARGAQLWASLLAADTALAEIDDPRREVALSACRTADRVEQLEQLARGTDPVVEGRAGPVIHPVFAEVRQQSALLARLLLALRLPDAGGRRPQRRPGPAGFTRPPVMPSSLELARMDRTGQSFSERMSASERMSNLEMVRAAMSDDDRLGELDDGEGSAS